MKTITLLFLGLSLTLMGYTQVSKTVNVATAGGLLSALTETELTTVTNLTVTGTIDAQDFKTMRDKMTKLAVLDISGVNIAEYTGTLGTIGSGNYLYPANTMPVSSFNTKRSLTSVTLPSTITSIGRSAFDACSKLSSINIPSSVTTIESKAFHWCTGLSVITIPSSVIYIGEYAFSDCGLTSVTIPSSVTSIGGYAFQYCESLTSVNILASITTIESSTFEYCTGLTSVNIPSSVTSIKGWAFSSCTSLTLVNIPSSVTSIDVFSFIRSSAELSVASNNPNYSSIDGILFNKTQTVIFHCPTSKIGSYTIPPTVTSIEFGAFASCTGLTSLTISSLVTSIEGSAFSECKNLTSVNIPSSVKNIGASAFEYCSSLSSLYIPASVTSIGLWAFNGSSGLKTVDSSNPNYLSIDGILFNKAQTTLIHCPISTIGEYIIPSSVTSLESYSFSGCTLITSITIPSSVSSIKGGVFNNCKGLTSIYVKATVPVNLSSSYGVFDYINKTTCTLYVPVGSKIAYQAANQWKDFENIVEIATGLSTKEIPAINLFPNPFTEGFWISGIEGSALTTIIDLNGKILYRKQGSGNEYVSLKSLPNGIYIVKIFTNKGIVEKKMVKH